MTSALNQKADRTHWQALIVFAWALMAGYFIFYRWGAIQWFALGDTDDNMRLMQVRAWLSGQDWYDLRQYRLNPPAGADIHWSRFVDLPLAGLILLFRPFIGGANSEYVAVAIAPLLPLLVAMMGLGLAMRRLLGPWAFVLAIGVLMFCQGLLSMYMPTRIDHHGWQLAMLPWVVAGLADDNRRRGGITLAIASTISLVIGLEMVPYLAIAAGVVGLRWVIDAEEAPRLRAFGLTLAAATTLGFLGFASNVNWQPRCDALSPVWLSVVIIGGVLLFALGLLRSPDWRYRLGASLIAAGIVAGFYALMWPHCLGQLEGISPELYKAWFTHIREVKPITSQSRDFQIALGYSVLIGPLGALFAMRQSRGSNAFGAWGAVFLLSLCSSALIFWQSRAGPAVQMLSIPGATALAWHILPKLRASSSVLVRVFGTVAAFALISGLGVQLLLIVKPEAPEKPVKSKSGKADAKCSTIPSLAPIGRLAPGTVFTFVDLSPRLIALTPHSAIAGPYHRNGDAILDVHHVFRGTAAEAEQIVRRHKSKYLLICPGSPESTIYKAEAPKGFYSQLEQGQVPAWLTPITLPKASPFVMWEVKPL